MKEKKTIIINLFGGPGSGKSTTAAGVFYNLKKRGVDVEMSLEFAKDKVWEESFKAMENQYYIFGKQFHRLWRLVGKVDYIITDSPILNLPVYDAEGSEKFKEFIKELNSKFINFNFFILRNPKVYIESGRIQGKEESEEIDNQILHWLEECGEEYTPLPQFDAVEWIVDFILRPSGVDKK